MDKNEGLTVYEEQAIKILLTEYESIRSEIGHLYSMRSSLLQYIFVSVTAIVTIVFGFLGGAIPHDALGWLLLVLPIPFMGLGATYVGVVRIHYEVAAYSYRSIGSSIRAIVHADADHRLSSLMQWDQHWLQGPKIGNIPINNIIAGTGEFILLAIPVFSCLILFMYYALSGIIAFSLGLGLLLGFDLILLVGVLWLFWLAYRPIGTILPGRSGD